MTESLTFYQYLKKQIGVNSELLKRFEEPYAKEIEYDMALEFISILKKIKESEE
jgi:hypothetical protein